MNINRRLSNLADSAKADREFRKKYGESSFWIPRELDLLERGDYQKPDATDPYMLAAKKRSIASFVSILTGKSIPVSFNTKGDSYTDGNHIVISSAIAKPEDFDLAVGIALHEGSHIKLSNFSVNTISSMRLALRKAKTNLDSNGRMIYLSHEFDDNLLCFTKVINNWIEDRRIDQYVRSVAPGYRGYYERVYLEYFSNKIISEALKSVYARDVTYDSYRFRIVNFINKSTDFNALPSLRTIWRLIDVKNIDRLKNSEDVLAVAAEVCILVKIEIDKALKNPASADSNKSKQSGKSSKQQSGGNTDTDNGDNGDQELDSEDLEGLLDTLFGDESDDKDTAKSDNDNAGGAANDDKADADDTDTDDTNTGTDADSDSDSDDTDVDDTDADSDDTDDTDNGYSINNGGASSLPELDDKSKDKLKRLLDDQLNVLDNNFKKKELSRKQSEAVKGIDASGTEMKDVEYDISGVHKKVKVIVIKNFNQVSVDTMTVPGIRREYTRDGKTGKYYYKPYSRNTENIDKAVSAGIILAKHLQIRNESRTTLFNRQRSGKIDKRMLHAAGFDSENIFLNSFTDKYKKANLHISIDASTSMAGKKWKNTMFVATALCVAGTIIKNIDVQLSIRYTKEFSMRVESYPVLLMAFDSRKDKISKIKSLFAYLEPSGNTPEGLCFETLINELVGGSTEVDSYFLNVSDGQPFFGDYYHGQFGITHTAKAVKKILEKGIRVMGYFVHDSNSYGDSKDVAFNNFVAMYGKSSSHSIDVTDIQSIVKTMNALFLSK